MKVISVELMGGSFHWYALMAIPLFILLVSLMGHVQADDYQNVFNLTGASEIDAIALDSDHDSIFLFTRFSINAWGFSNQTQYWHFMTFGNGNVKLDWSDDHQLLAYAHDSISGGIDEPGIFLSELLVVDYSGRIIACIEPYGNLTSNENRTIIDLEWHPSEPLLAVAFGDGRVKIYDIESKALSLERQFKVPVMKVRWSNRGSTLAILVGDADRAQELDFWDIEKNVTEENPQRGLTYRITDIGWTFDDGRLLLLLDVGDVWAYNLSSLAMETICSRGTDAMFPAHTIPVIAIVGESVVGFYNYQSGEAEYHGIYFTQSTFGGWTTDDAYACTVDQVGIIRIWTREMSVEYPSIGIIFPTDSWEVTGCLTVEGWASSASGVGGSVHVRFGLDDWRLATGFSNWTCVLNSTLYENGPLTIRARALDATGFSSIVVRRVFVNNTGAHVNAPPEIDVQEPLAGSRLSNSILLKGIATDDVGITSIHYRIGNENWRSFPVSERSTRTEWMYVVIAYQSGPIDIRLRAFDGSLFSETVVMPIEVVMPTQPEKNLTIEVEYPQYFGDVPPDFTILGRSTGSPDSIFITIDDFSTYWIDGAPSWKCGIPDLAEGYHVLRAVGVKGSTYSQWKIVQFDVVLTEPVNSRPMVRIDYPSPEAVLEGDFVVRGWSIDDGEVRDVEIRLDNGTWQAVNGTLNWTFPMDISGRKAGWLTVEVRAFDGELFSDSDSRQYYLGIIEPRVQTSDMSIYIILVLLVIVCSLFAYVFWILKHPHG